MENYIVKRIRANVAQYANGDVDVRWPEEHEELNLQILSKTMAGSLTKNQGKSSMLLYDEKSRADADDPVSDLSEECANLLQDL